LQEILSIGLDMTAAQYGSFELFDKKQKMLTIKALAGRNITAAAGPPLPADESSVVGWVAVRRQSLLIADLHELPWRDIYQPLPADQPMRSELAVPLIGPGGGLEGVLNLESPLPGAFTDDDRRLLESLAVQAIIAIQEQRLLDAIHYIEERLLTAHEEELFALIVDKACDLINVPVGAIWTITDPNTLVLRQSPEGYRRAKQLPLDNSLTGHAIRLRRPITVDDLRTHPGFRYRDLAVEQGWVSAIIVPLLMPGSGQALGCLSLYAHALRDFSDWDKKLLTILANHAAIAIQNAREVARLKSHNLSDREQEVLTLLIEGRTNKEIADALTVTVNTVKKHVQSIFTKLNVDNRAAAVAKALER
jgi:GAF domain-containing protein